MRILITGGLGRIGLATIRFCLQQGHQLRVIDTVAADQMAPQQSEICDLIDYHQVDIRDEAAVSKACDGIEAIIHLAAIPNYSVGQERAIFHINVGGTYQLYLAAAEHGIQKVIAASSINYLGNGFGANWTPIHYFPIDEAHPGAAADPYAFSKQILEQTAAYFYRRHNISTVSFRFPLTYIPEWVSEEKMMRSYHRSQDAMAWLNSMSLKKKRTTISQLKSDFLALRAKRIKRQISYWDLYRFFDDVPGGPLLWNFDNYWALLDVRDAARALERAAVLSFTGCIPLYVADSTNNLGIPAADLVVLFYPNVQINSSLNQYQSLLDTRAAENFLNLSLHYSSQGLLENFLAQTPSHPS